MMDNQERARHYAKCGYLREAVERSSAPDSLLSEVADAIGRDMRVNDYQNEALRTSIGDEKHVKHPELRRHMMLCWALGLSGEAGEFADRIKKEYFHNHVVDEDKRLKELGDVAWYLAVAANEAGFTLQEVMEANLSKLRRRYPHGFNPEDSVRRVDVTEHNKGHIGCCIPEY